MDLKTAALQYAEMGLAVIPLKYNKTPLTRHGCKDASRDPEQIAQWWGRWKNANIGIATGAINNIVVIDLDRDADKGEDGTELLRTWESENGKLPETWTAVTGRGGNHLIFKLNEKYHDYRNIQDAKIDGHPMGIDIRGNGGYIVAPPSKHPNGNFYYWDIAPDDMHIAEVDEQTDKFINWTRSHCSNADKNGKKTGYVLPDKIPNGTRTAELVSLIGKTSCLGLQETEIREIVTKVNERCEQPLSDKELEKEVFPALTRGWGAKEPLNETVSATAGIESLVRKLEQLDACNNYPSNDMGTARLFAEVFRDECRYSPTVKDWMHYDGIKWQRDYEGMAARGCCKQLADAFLRYAASCNLDGERRTAYLKYAVSLTSYRVRNTIVNDSREINRFTSEQMDADDYLLNCLNGTLDLHGDKPIFREHRPDDLVSKVSGTDYDPAAKCPRWEQALREIFEDNTDKIDYLQKVLGYCLTGCTKEEEMYFLYGASSRNGKSTITETALYIMGDYGQTITPETLAVKPNKDSRTASPDIAKLRGARLVIASEPPKRMLFDNAQVKTMTGRDQITARALYENEITFMPKFKMMLNTNYLPTITDPTVFMSNRIKVITFNKHFSEQEQDKTLKDKLRSEAPGILNWMIEGYYRYKADGLNPPNAVNLATEEYAADSDKMQKFIDDCLIKSDGNCKGADVYKVYEKWTSENGYGCESKGNFFSDLKTKGIYRASGRVNGTPCKNIIHGYEIDAFTEVQPGEELPFK